MGKKLPPPIKTSVEDAIEDNENAIQIAREELERQMDKKIGAGDILAIPLNKIVEIQINGKPMHNRTAYSKTKVVELAEELEYLAEQGGGVELNGKATGLLHPIIVRKSKSNPDLYERIIGFRRYKAFEHNKSSDIPSILFDCDDKTARMLRTSENRNREDLNPYDNLISVLEELQLAIGVSTIQEVVDFLHKYQNSINASKKNQAINWNDDDEKNKLIIDEELKKFKFTINTLIRKKLIILNLHDLIKIEMTENKINYTNAVIVNQLKDDDLVKSALVYIKENSPENKDITSKDVQTYVTKLKNIPQDNSPISKIKNSFSVINKAEYKKFNAQKKEVADKLMLEIEEKLKEYKKLSIADK